jgi:hypothetical protein
MVATRTSVRTDFLALQAGREVPAAQGVLAGLVAKVEWVVLEVMAAHVLPLMR